jgi:hypothetical protein
VDDTPLRRDEGNEKAASAVDFIKAAAAYYRRPGIAIARVL